MQALNQPDQEQPAIQVEQEFIYLVSHQLLNSAQKLLTISEIWSEPEASLEQLQVDVLQVLRHEVTYLHRLSRDILHLDPTAKSELPFNLKFIDLVGLIEQMLPSFQLQGRDREFKNHYEADLPPVWGDAERLQDVLNNLVSNALKYSAPFSPIIISTQRADDQIKVSVTNSGSTIPAGDEERIFTKFYRGQGHHQPGDGLGLYLARRLVEQHGGRIWVESLSVEATTFYFTLPLVDQEQVGAPSTGNLGLLTLSVQKSALNGNDRSSPG